ncbi:MAG: FtsQ-type POTRA domain-containing protein [Desulfatiglans sp.]|nr:FtsQ-type POTRA domain-containing protein [Desulfatiglans sp.]
MKKKVILSKQAVSRRRPKDYSVIFRAFKALAIMSTKIFGLCMVAVSISVFFIYLYQYLITSPYVRLEEVRISGVDEKTKRELIEISNLDSELCLLTIDLTDIKRKMEEHPWIKRVELEKSFPNLLLVRAEKENPYAILVLDSLYYLNREGLPFKEITYNDNKDFPVITGISPKSSRRDHYLKLAVEILSAFEMEKGAWSKEELSELHFEDGEKVSLYSISMPLVLKMGCSEFDEKKIELKKILGHLKETGRIEMVKAIDLNYTKGAVVSFRDAG